jgi:hypothetical protein
MIRDRGEIQRHKMSVNKSNYDANFRSQTLLAAKIDISPLSTVKNAQNFRMVHARQQGYTEWKRKPWSGNRLIKLLMVYYVI